MRDVLRRRKVPGRWRRQIFWLITGTGLLSSSTIRNSQINRKPSVPKVAFSTTPSPHQNPSKKSHCSKPHLNTTKSRPKPVTKPKDPHPTFTRLSKPKNHPFRATNAKSSSKNRSKTFSRNSPAKTNWSARSGATKNCSWPAKNDSIFKTKTLSIPTTHLPTITNTSRTYSRRMSKLWIRMTKTTFLAIHNSFRRIS